MGIPIEPRLCATARRKRQRVALLPDRTARERPPRGIDAAAVRAVVAYYAALASAPGDAAPCGRLDLVRTRLTRPAEVHRSPIFQVGGATDIITVENDVDDAASVANAESDHWSSDSDESRRSAEFRDDRRVRRSRARVMLTTNAVSMLYTDCTPGSDRNFSVELGCWAGTHELAGIDIFQIFLDVAVEATTFVTCDIDTLCICDSLGTLHGVAEGLDLLKVRSSEFHPAEENASETDYFIHPITGARIAITFE